MARYARQASSVYQASPWLMFLRTLSICRTHKYCAEEAFRLGLFNPHLQPGDLACYCSREHLTKIQKSLNPASLVPLLRNKALFYRFCLAHQTPIPKLYALCYDGTLGWTRRTPVIAQPREWEAFFEQEAPAEFVVKPTEAAFGQGINIYRRHGTKFIDTSQSIYTKGEVYRHLCTSSKPSGFIVQERVRNHPEIIRLTDAHGLQTARLTTLLDGTGQCRIIHTHFKLIVGDNITDNFAHGASGNLQARVNLNNGRLWRPVAASPGVPGFRATKEHPDTGQAIEGFRLPFWSEACHLVERTAPLFLPLQTIGWDVALTPDGPVIIEGNAWWDPPNQNQNLDTILEQLGNMPHGRC